MKQAFLKTMSNDYFLYLKTKKEFIGKRDKEITAKVKLRCKIKSTEILVGMSKISEPIFTMINVIDHLTKYIKQVNGESCEITMETCRKTAVHFDLTFASIMCSFFMALDKIDPLRVLENEEQLILNEAFLSISEDIPFAETRKPWEMLVFFLYNATSAVTSISFFDPLFNYMIRNNAMDNVTLSRIRYRKERSGLFKGVELKDKYCFDVIEKEHLDVFFYSYMMRFARDHFVFGCDLLWTTCRDILMNEEYRKFKYILQYFCEEGNEESDVKKLKKKIPATVISINETLQDDLSICMVTYKDMEEVKKHILEADYSGLDKFIHDESS